MPGRIKPTHTHESFHDHQNLNPRPHLSHLRRQAPLNEQPNQDNPGSLFENQNKGFVLNRQTIIWLAVISVIVLVTLVVVSCLLCKCNRRRWKSDKNGEGDGNGEGLKRHPDGSRWHPSLEIKDGRNEFHAWNRHAPPRASLAEQGGQGIRMDTWESGDSIAPLRPTASARSRGQTNNGSAVMEPVVVDYAAPAPPKKNSRYYSNLSSGRGSLWKRISQIGRAY